ncbi:MAG: CPBP family intramembrane glutamic endopeptidase [Promethearchaeota archaeon]
MNDKEIPQKSNDQESTEYTWSFCPICGDKLPKVQNVKFCIKCGTNIEFIKKHRQLPPDQVNNPYKITTTQPQYPSFFIEYGPEKISDEDILNTKDRKLWSTLTSIGLPLGAFIALEFLLAGLFVVIILFTNSINAIYGLASNLYFTALISVFELIFAIIPMINVGKYLQNPTIKNRLALLGFTSKGYDRRRILKEILIGLSFAIMGFIIVYSVSTLIEIIFEKGLGIEIVSDDSGIEAGILSSDLLSIILLVVVMILFIGTTEEILFRGFMQKGLVRNLGNKWGILLTAFIFAFIHIIGIFLIFESPVTIFLSFVISFIPYFIISLILGWLFFWRNENLIANMTCHGVFNAIQIIIAYILVQAF